MPQSGLKTRPVEPVIFITVFNRAILPVTTGPDFDWIPVSAPELTLSCLLDILSFFLSSNQFILLPGIHDLLTQCLISFFCKSNLKLLIRT